MEQFSGFTRVIFYTLERLSLLKQYTWTFGALRQTQLFFKLSMDYVAILEKQSKALIAQLTSLLKTSDKSMTNYTINRLFIPCVYILSLSDYIR